MKRGPTLLIDGHRIQFEPQELTIFAALYNAKGVALSLCRLASILYDHREDGGCEQTRNVITVRTSALKIKLQPTRFRIRCHYAARSMVRVA